MIEERIGGKSLSKKSVQQRRDLYICAALQGLLANPQTAYQIQQAHGGEASSEIADKYIIQKAIRLADKAIAESKKPWN
jgi:hypothetical protein